MMKVFAQRISLKFLFSVLVLVTLLFFLLSFLTLSNVALDEVSNAIHFNSVQSVSKVTTGSKPNLKRIQVDVDDPISVEKQQHVSRQTESHIVEAPKRGLRNEERLLEESALKVAQPKNDEKYQAQSQKVKRRDFSPTADVHIFYYPWYGNVETDGKFVHWNHEYLPHWDPKIARRYQQGKHAPPNDIGSNFYPALGPYSSRDSQTIHNHMYQIQSSGAQVLSVSWYPPEKADSQGIPSDSLIPQLLDISHEYGLKITFHLEPYKERDDRAVLNSVKYILDTYGDHPAFYRRTTSAGKLLPFFYVYDSYKTSVQQWANILKPGGAQSLRGTKYDAIFICLVAEAAHKDCVTKGGFDGFYTYFATNQFTFGSTWKQWPQLAEFAKKKGALFIPSVGPGYVDTQIRPWNSMNTRSRENGAYYQRSWEAALGLQPEIVSITSFNEWHEGTQVERAVPKTGAGFTYLDYGSGGPDMYLNLTRKLVGRFRPSKL